jgi:hypothetical protein
MFCKCEALSSNASPTKNKSGNGGTKWLNIYLSTYVVDNEGTGDSESPHEGSDSWPGMEGLRTWRELEQGRYRDCVSTGSCSGFPQGKALAEGCLSWEDNLVLRGPVLGSLTFTL